ncbi:MAG: type B 50S ribosomal protein L31 [bacterium]
MKDNHPDYREVVFHDLSSNEKFIVGSSAPAEKTTEVDGEEYPLVEVEISSASHPFYTGEQRLVDTEGRVEKFRKKYGDSEDEDTEDEE